jgi:CubicO group peptidase (beta-lactamase class C family)
MLNEGEINGQRLFPAEVVERSARGATRRSSAGFPTIPNGSYTSQWWVFHNDHGAYAARGVHGQTIYVDPTAEMVLVRLRLLPARAERLHRPDLAARLPGGKSSSAWKSTPRSRATRNCFPGLDRIRQAANPMSASSMRRCPACCR